MLKWMLPAVLAMGCAASDPGTPLPALAGGRVVAEGNGAARFGWPGTYFEGRFRGARVTVSVENQDDILRVMIDGKEAGRITEPGTITRSFDVAAGEHVIRLEKVTESQAGSTRFLGFRTSGEALPARRISGGIEFIGDSHSVGYGDTSPVHECSQAKIHETTDTQQAFGPLAARKLRADYRVIAWSGRGIVRNYDNFAPGEAMPQLYPRAIPGEAAPAAGDDWRPQVVVINLGTNDFSTPVKPGEPWADAAALHADYRAKYIAFVRMLHARQPQARFVLMGADSFIADVQAVATVTGATALHTPALELTGCDWHPSLKDQQTMADAVIGAIGRL
jgi:lysophospholipase L1-like esterase